jgi:hypothetical protein
MAGSSRLDWRQREQARLLYVIAVVLAVAAVVVPKSPGPAWVLIVLAALVAVVGVVLSRLGGRAAA